MQNVHVRTAGATCQPPVSRQQPTHQSTTQQHHQAVRRQHPPLAGQASQTVALVSHVPISAAFRDQTISGHDGAGFAAVTAIQQSAVPNCTSADLCCL